MPDRIRTYRVHYEGFQVLSTAFSFLPSQAWPGARHRFCQAIERPDLETDPRFATNADRVRNRAELDDLLADIFRQRPAAEWDRVMREHRIPAAPPAGVGESVERARARGQLLPLPPGPYGELATLAAPFLFDGHRPEPWLPPPALGEHTAEVLAELSAPPPPP